MNFDTAIYYDIENLIGGYGFRQDDIQKVSLRAIHDQIKNLDLVGEVAIQRAYANWSDGRLQSLRHDMVELGIEPVQMFGFGRGSTHNASDIQLAIDVVETALTRSYIKRFVIVSGDGGFSTLAKKLHEYNRVVIGCAWQKASNRVLEAICDDFIWLEPPSCPSNGGNPSATEVNDPVLKSLLARLDGSAKQGKTSTLEKAQEVFAGLIQTPDALRALRGQGMNVSIVSQALQLGITDFKVARCGFARLIDLIRHLCHESKVKLVLKEPSDYRLALRTVGLRGYEPVETIAEAPTLHSVAQYRNLLERGAPRLKFPTDDSLIRAASLLTDHSRMAPSYLREELQQLLMYLEGMGESVVNDILVTFLQSSVLVVKEMVGDQATLACCMKSPQELLQLVGQCAYQKLQQELGSVESQLLTEILGWEMDFSSEEEQATLSA